MDFSAIGRQFGLDAQQTQAAFDALAPVVAAGIRRNTQSDDGLAGLVAALAGGNHARYVEEPSAYEAVETVDDGNAILGHVFGSKDVSRGVAQQLSASSGIGSSILKKLLPIVAAMVMGQVAKKALGGRGASPSSGGGGGLGDILGDILGGGVQRPTPQQQPQSGGGGIGDILGDILGGGAGQRPSGGSQGGGLGDILGDILGGGKQQPEPSPRPQRSPGGGIEDLLKDILGGGGAAPAPQRVERVTRTRRTLDDILGGGSSRGTAADDLLSSVEQAIRRR
jgi:hypothetical protein